MSEVITNNVTVTVKQTSELFVINGLTVCLRCDFDPGVPPADTVVWLRDNMLIDLRDSCLDLGSDDGGVLCIEEITRPYSAEYSCRVSNLAGSDTGGIDVTVPGMQSVLSGYLEWWLGCNLQIVLFTQYILISVSIAYIYVLSER